LVFILKKEINSSIEFIGYMKKIEAKKNKKEIKFAQKESCQMS
jgi:hypothetical protein